MLRTESWLVFVTLAAIVSVIIVCDYFVPASVADAFYRTIRHPSFVVPFWLFMLWCLHGQWHRQNGKVEA
jgi:hypothetical protein